MKLWPKLFIVFVSLMMVTVTVVLGSRTITDSQDDIYSQIRNSNGKHWAATAANIQLAINDLSSGGTVYLPPGTIDVTTTLYINNDGITLQGANGGSWETEGATILELDANTDILNINGTESDSLGRVVVEDIKFYNDGRTQSGSAINIEYCLNPMIINCGFNRIKGSAIYFNKWVYGSKIINCDFQNCGDTGDYTVHFHGGATENMSITAPIIENCIFERSNKRDIGDDGQTYSSKRAMIKNNYFEGYNNSGTAEPADGHIRGTMIYTTIVDNNFIDQHDVVPYGVKLASYGCIVKGNRFEGFDIGLELTQHWSVASDNYLFEFRTTAIHIYQDHCTVSGNIIKAGGDRGIHMQTALYCTIVGNTIDDTDVYAIYIQDSHGNTLIGNSLIDGADGIFSLNSENCTISGNTIFDMTDDGIDLNTGNSNNVGYNVMSGCGTGIESNDGAATVTADNIIG